MTRKTMLALLAQADSTLADNTTGDITPAVLRTMVKDIIDSFSPGYGAANSASLTLTTLGSTPRVIPYVTKLAETIEFVVTIAAGTIMSRTTNIPFNVAAAPAPTPVPPPNPGASKLADLAATMAVGTWASLAVPNQIQILGAASHPSPGNGMRRPLSVRMWPV